MGMPKDVDLVEGKRMFFRGEPVRYIGRSAHGGFVIQLPDTRNSRGAPEFHFKSAHLFELSMVDPSKLEMVG